MTSSFLGIDVGTTNVKTAAFNESGDLLAYHAVGTPIVHPRPEFSEFPAETLWQCVCKCISSVVSRIGAETIRSVGVSAMAEGGLLLKATGEPMTNIIAWYDMRSIDHCKMLETRMGTDQLYLATGQTPSAKYGVTKLMWLAQHEPKQVEEAAHWLSVEDYMLFRLSGEYATDYSVAARTMAFDIHRQQWSDSILRCAGVEQSLFPKAYPGGSQIGVVSRKAHEECGLPQGIPVCTGGHDHACAAMAVDILQEGVCMDSMGTAEVSMMAVASSNLIRKGHEQYYSVYPHCGEKLFRALTSNQSCGVCIEWALRMFGADIVAEAARKDLSKYDLFLADLTNGEGAYFFPFLRGSVEQTGVQGVFWGLSDQHTRKDLVSAVVDGLCYELKRQIEGFETMFGTRARHLRVVGGLSKSASIMSRKSRVQGCTVSIPKNTEAACYGAAILGGLGAGALAWGESHFVCGTEYGVQAENVDQERYEHYLKLRRSVMQLYERMDGR